MIKSSTMKDIHLHTDEVNGDAQQTKDQQQDHIMRKSKSAVIPTAVDYNNDAASPDCETDAEPLPWLLEVNSNYSSLPKRGQKKRGPKIKRVFPWTIETQHDANVLRKQQNIFEGIDTENILNSLPRLNGIEMFRPDSPKLLMKSTVEKYKQLMLEEEEQEKNAVAKKENTIVVTTKVEDDENIASKMRDVFTKNSNNDLSQMKHELKSLKKSLRNKSANIALGGKSKTLERIGYKTHHQQQRRRRKRQVRAKSLPKLNRALLLPSQLNTTTTTIK